MRFRLLRCLAKAAVKHGVKFACGLMPGGEVFYDFITDAWKDYRREGQEGDRRGEVEQLAQATGDQVRQEVQEVVQAEAVGLPPEEREALATYLAQVPGTIRRSLRRPSDPTGTTVPGGLRLRRPEDLLRFLPTRPPRFKPGDRPLPGVDWVLEELVGVGGFGEVWKARHAHLKSMPAVALKFCLNESAVSALRNEAGVLDRVMRHRRHPGVVALLQTYLDANPPCLEYEYIEGGDLAGLIQELHERGRLKPDMANRLLLHLAEVVASFHRADPPIVHGDPKPANVLVQRESGKIKLRVTDFGIGGLAAARAAQEKRQPTRSRQGLLTEAVRGAYTPLYASPQQMTRRQGEPADPRDDVHALGVIWLQLLTGDLGMMSVPPDWREQVEERGLEGDLVQLLASCIASKAEKRPAAAVALVEQLKAALSRAEKDKQDTQELEADLREWERILFITGTSERFLREAAPRRMSAWRAAAEHDSPGGQLLLGLCLAFGQGVAQDHAEALRWLRRAADQGYAAAQANIGCMCENGLGVKKDFTEALRWYCLAADQHLALAQVNIGWMYEKGLGVKQDYGEALRWYRKAADQGYAPAQTNIGNMYRSGEGVERDPAEALRWYREAAEKGYVVAQFHLGFIYGEGVLVAQDHAEALRWYRKAADQGLGIAKYEIERMRNQGLK
jgi:TPR repeat protein